MSASFAPDNLDALTGLFNGRYFERALAEEVAVAHGEDRPLALILFDIDGLKRVNDRFGHASGDTLLAVVGLRVREVVGSADIPCRIGGDEFAIVLPDSTREDALLVYSRLDSKLAAHPLASPSLDLIGKVMLSVGIVRLQPGENAEALVRRADDALYQLKTTGKPRLVAETTAAVEEGRAEAAGESKPPEQVVWEYWIEEGGEPLLDRLNQLGAEGWELAGVAGGKLVFKRRRYEPPDDEGSGVREPRRPRPSAGSAPVRKPLDDDNS